MTDERLIERMANRFLAWKLPENFNPDNGISAKRPNYAPNVPWEPTGTNLFDADQAKAMVRHMLDGEAAFASSDRADLVRRVQELEAALGRISLLRPAGDVNTAPNARSLVQQMEAIALTALKEQGHG